jgi:PPOX class probable F420-dependent enzyme
VVTAALAAAGEFGATARVRLEQHKLAWLTTISSDGTPQPNPVWFIVDGEAIVIFSKPNQAKLKNIARHPKVAFNLEATETEEEITILTGTAEVGDTSMLSPELLDRYAVKYEQGMKGINMTREEYEAAYTSIIRFTPAKVRGW